MNIKYTIVRPLAFIMVVSLFLACDDDFNSIGSSVVGAPGFNAEVYELSEISARNHNLGPVQTNGLPVNLLGVHDDEVFGLQTAGIYTQLGLQSTNPTFGENPVLDSVVLNIPYFSREVASEEEGTQYELDSVFGNAPIKLSVLVSNYYLNPFDPDAGFETAQKYYSSLGSKIEANLTGEVLFETENFIPSKEELVEFGVGDDGEMDTIRLEPRMRLHLDVPFFQEKILDKQGSAALSSTVNFNDYLRGIYFKAEALNENGNLMMLNMGNSEGGITLYYTVEEVDTNDIDGDGDTSETIEVPKQFKLSFGPQRVNTFEQDNPVPVEGNLFLKGGEGSMTIIDLFSGMDSNDDGISDELESLRENEWLINEANLIFQVNKELVDQSNEPEHLMLYDLKNNRVLEDYRFDRPNSANELISRTNSQHLGPLERDEDGHGVSYKIRITNHINNLLNRDSTNLKLGLVVTQNINLVQPFKVDDTEVEMVPVGSVVSPSGTVLYGPEAADEEKRLKLRIYYTEPKN